MRWSAERCERFDRTVMTIVGRHCTDDPSENLPPLFDSCPVVADQPDSQRLFRASKARDGRAVDLLR